MKTLQATSRDFVTRSAASQPYMLYPEIHEVNLWQVYQKVGKISSFMAQSSQEKSPTCYMLPNLEEGKGLVDYSLNPHMPTKYPMATKNR